jgi:ketosteroid isomerase-like protein
MSENVDTIRGGYEAFARQDIADVIEVPFAHVWTMRDGKAVRFREYADSNLVAQAIG